MTIEPRDLVEKFSTFLDIDASQSSRYNLRWIVSPELKRSMIVEQNKNPSITEENAWAQFWLSRAIKGDNLAQKHLSAYLEVSCYCAAFKLKRNFAQKELNWHNWFQQARLAALRSDKLLKTYDLRRSSVISYASFKLYEIIKEALIPNAKSDMGLLRSLSPKRLREDLECIAMREPELSIHILVLYCFKEIYTPTNSNGRLLPKLTQEWYAKIAKRYNELRLTQDINSPVTGKEIKEILDKCVLVARKRYPDTKNLLPLPEEDALEDLLDSTEEIDTEYQDFLISAFESLAAEAKLMLRLYHGLNLTHIDIVQVLKLNGISISQATVSRRIAFFKRQLLRELVIWCANHLGKSLNSGMNNKMANKLAKQLYIWLDPFCQDPINNFLSLTMQPKILSNGISREVLFFLKTDLKQFLENKWQIELNSLDPIDPAMGKYVENWLNR